jgi:hypothetical protein
MVAPCYFKDSWYREKSAKPPETIPEDGRLAKEFNVHKDTSVKTRKTRSYVPVFIGNIYNGLKSVLF